MSLSYDSKLRGEFEGSSILAYYFSPFHKCWRPALVYIQSDGKHRGYSTVHSIPKCKGLIPFFGVI